ncbi:unnamed protein product [Dovyalis caffra]|uniref:Uncharacterized protein n=1 Tax=Dovyalis caffra TaxID=77055 RepID=A0AAV1RZS5_9ROSI|nr:unnamed protein product [Dovyalis caffra]
MNGGRWVKTWGLHFATRNLPNANLAKNFVPLTPIYKSILEWGPRGPQEWLFTKSLALGFKPKKNSCPPAYPEIQNRAQYVEDQEDLWERSPNVVIE